MTLSHTASQVHRSVSLLRDVPTRDLLAGIECVDCDRADIATNRDDWSYPLETDEYLRRRRADFAAEIARRERLRHHPLAPAWPDPRRDLDEIRERVDLVDFIEKQTATTFVRRGSSFRAYCPFPDHPAHSPGFSVDLTRQKWFCFGCLRGGDVFTFVQELLGCEFRTAVDLLADEVGVTRPRPANRGRVRVGSVRVA